MRNRLLAFASVAALLLAACGGGGTATTAPGNTTPAATTPASTGGTAAGCTVGVSWNNYQEERWAKWDEPAIKAAIEKGGGKYISNDAKSSADTQTSNVANLISQGGAKVVIILAQDGTAIKTAVTAALAANVPVIAYDRLIEDPKALYVTFDNKLVGKLQAQALLKVKDAGNYVVIKGNKADANADFLRAGMVEAGLPEAGKSSDKLKNVGETYTDNWDPAKAQAEMEQFLTANSNKIDLAFVENDGMAGGAIAALTAQGLAGSVPVSGQDGDLAALNRVALGTQTVDVWKDARLLGKAAGESAIALCANPDPSKVSGTASFTTPGGNNVSAIQLTPNPITKDNLKDVLDAGWITKDKLCKGVTAGSVTGC